MTPDYNTAVLCLHENLTLLDGAAAAEHKALWNISNSLLVALDALKNLEARVARLEQTK
jgi:hypothetical protein